MIASAPPFCIEKVRISRLQTIDFNNLGFGKIFSDHMFVMEYRDRIWKEGQIKPFGKISISPVASALHYGQAIFEGLKAYRAQDDSVVIFRPWENSERMNYSAKRMCMPELPEGIFIEALSQLIALDRAWIPRKEGSSLYIRPVMFAIDEYVGVRASDSYMFVVFTCPVDKYYSHELRVKIEKEFTRASKGGTGHAKAAGNYAASLYPTKLAKEAGYDQILWTDGLTHEYFEESGTMNVVFRAGNTVFTPAVSDSILDGVTRDSVLQIARDWNFNVEERRVSVAEVVGLLKEGKLDEAFGAGTAATVAPITTIGHEGTDYQLRPFAEWTFAPKAAKELDDIKHGRIPDRHSWNLVVK